MKKLRLLTIFCSLAAVILASPNDGWNEEMRLFTYQDTTNTNSYRIPAITTTSQGTVIAVADYRHNGASDIGLNEGVDFAVRVSNDGGNTWTEKQIITPENGVGISDPAIVHNPETGTTFLFGYQNDVFITNKNGESDFFMYTSDDGGITWDKGQSLKNLTPEGYKYILQGPGSGMYYNGTIYMPIQAWHHEKDNSGTTCTSGFIYSTDNGKTWNTSILRPENLPAGTADYPDITSESNIFHHNGKIYLAAKPETSRESKKRVVWATSDNGKTWERVYEDFIPDNVAQCESSSLSLNDQVYLVGYTLNTKNSGRDGIYITTNTGKSIKVFDEPTRGYTSMSQDLDNLYILFEGENQSDVADILFRRFDISAKEYANINAQLLERGKNLLDIQNKLFASRSYLTGEYTNQSDSGVESVLLNGNYKIGAFYKNTKDNSDDVYRTIAYDTQETTLVLSQDNVITSNDNIFAGYQYTKLEYHNGSKNNINSFVIGYSLEHEFNNDYGYSFGINGIYNNNKLERNKAEGLGKSADFDSYTLTMKNEFFKSIDLQNQTDLKLSLGLKTTMFGHDDIKEENGNNFNDAFVKKSKNFSNEIYANADIKKGIQINDKLTLNLKGDLGYRKELMNEDNWRDEFTVLDVTKEFATPVNKYNAGIIDAKLSIGLDINDKLEVIASYSVDSTGENFATGKMVYKF